MDLKMKLSDNLTLKEALRSTVATRHNLDNTPGENELENLKAVAVNCFQPIRDFIGGPLFVSSGYRAPKVNKLAKGSDTSSHMRGEALDLDCDVFESNGITNKDVFEFAVKELQFDQLIWEYGDDNEPAWVHISYSRTHNRGQILRIDVLGTVLLGNKTMKKP